ncbi:MAG: BCD family MFS transporter [Granulosicoccus sp.]|nr:BCD family MFS transporter [Granulosicoccus sp.]
MNQTIGWFGVFRLGLVQTALGAIVVLTTSTINRVMVVELALPALLPGLLVGLHYAIQITRPRMGYGSDAGGRRTPWILGGMLVLALGGVLAALATSMIATTPAAGIALAVFAFVLVGLGVGASGTSLLVLLATSVAPRYRGAAASTVWIMMILGFIITAVIAGKALEPFSFERLVTVSACVSLIAFSVAALAVWGVEKHTSEPIDAPSQNHRQETERQADKAQGNFDGGFRAALRGVLDEPDSRRFSIFVFVSMLAYSAQDLVLEPFAGAVFGMSPGQSTALSGTQHGGVLAGMLLVALCTSVIGGRFFGSLRLWTIVGCVASALALFALAVGGQFASVFPLKAAVFALGLFNGVFAVAAIGSMMDLVGRGAQKREGTRMGVWGAAQAIAFGLAGVVATFAVDISRWVLGEVADAYAIVFFLQALLFVFAARLAAGIYQPAAAEVTGKFQAGRIAMEMDQ